MEIKKYKFLIISAVIGILFYVYIPKRPSVIESYKALFQAFSKLENPLGAAAVISPPIILFILFSLLVRKNYNGFYKKFVNTLGSSTGKKNSKYFIILTFFASSGVVILFLINSGLANPNIFLNKPQYITCSSNNKNSQKSELNLEEAYELIDKSKCSSYGKVLKTNYCNSNLGTWWVDIQSDELYKECKPACVIDLKTKIVTFQPRCE